MNIGNSEFIEFPFGRSATFGRLATSDSFFKSNLLKNAAERPRAGPLEHGVGPAQVSREEMWGLISAIRAESRFEFAPPAGPIAKRRFATLLAKISRA
jgi:hypothetical protein